MTKLYGYDRMTYLNILISTKTKTHEIMHLRKIEYIECLKWSEGEHRLVWRKSLNQFLSTDCFLSSS